MGQLKVTITNYSTAEWTRNNWVCETGTSGSLGSNDSILNTPSLSLEKDDGQTTACAEQIHLESISQDALWLQVGYIVNGGTDQFAVHLQQHFQEFSIGKGDTWQVFQNGVWVQKDEDSTPVTWTFDKYIVTATPTLQHQAASVEIIIKDKS